MYGKEYEEWREQRALEDGALAKLTEDEISALQRMWRDDMLNRLVWVGESGKQPRIKTEDS